jgi:anthranilate phosphoribosyltransferase
MLKNTVCIFKIDHTGFHDWIIILRTGIFSKRNHSKLIVEPTNAGRHSSMPIKESISKVVDGVNLSREETVSTFNDIMSGNATTAQIAAIIVALRMKGESIDEITGAAEVMRDKATHVIPANAERLIDTCGTGGDCSGTINVSTAAAFVAAGAGAVVAKHGNRSVSSECGSADVLEELGVNISVGPDLIKNCLDSIGIAFLFAPALHGAMKHAISPRKEIGIRTIFNILGPLTNPALARRQLLGVFAPQLTESLAQVLKNTGSIKAYVVHGMSGMDEISTVSETRVSELSNGTIHTTLVKPEDYGMQRVKIDTLKGGNSKQNADSIRNILAGAKGPCRDIVILNAAFAIAASGICETPRDGISLAVKSIDSGAAMDKLEKLAKLTCSE